MNDLAPFVTLTPEQLAQAGFGPDAVGQIQDLRSAMLGAPQEPPEPELVARPPAAAPQVAPAALPPPQVAPPVRSGPSVPGPMASLGMAQQRTTAAGERYGEAVADMAQAATRQAEAERDAITRYGEIAKEKIAEQTRVETEMRRDMADLRSQRAAMDKRAAEARTARLDEVRRASAEARESARQGVDSGRLFKDENGDTNLGRSMGAALAVALSGIGMAIAGRPGENPAMSLITQAIDRDVAEQRDNIRAKAQAAAEARGLLEDQVAMDNLERQAWGEAVVIRLDTWKDRLEDSLAKFKGSELEVEIQKQIAEVSGKRDQVLAQIGVDAADHETKIAAQEASIAGTRAGLAMQQQQIDMAKDARSADGAARIAEELRKQGNYERAGLSGQPTYDGADKEAIQLKGDVEGMRASIRDLYQHVKDHGWEVFGTGSEAGAVAQAKLRAVQVQLKGKAFFDLGVLAGADMDLIEGMVDNPSGMRSDKTRAKIENLFDYVNKQAQAKLEARGFTERDSQHLTQQETDAEKAKAAGGVRQ